MSTSELRLLSDVSSRLNSDLDIDRVLADVLDLTVHRAGASNGSILVFDERGSVVHRILARAGLPPEEEQAVIEDVLAQGLAGWMVQHRQGAVIANVLTDERWISFPDDDFLDGSAIGVPLMRHDRLIGVLTLRHVDDDHFGEDQLFLLSSIADQATIAIENARLFYSVQVERAKMEAIIDGAGDAIMVTDEDGCVLMINAVAHEALGIPAGDLSGRYLTALVQIPAFHKLWTHRTSGAHPSTGEIPLPEGRTFHASLTHVADVGFVIVMQDISYLKQLDQLKDEFVSAVSHDLRSPLQLILTYTSLIPGAGALTSQQKDFLEGINRGVRRMTNLIDDLLDLAKIEAGMGMNRQECHLDRVIPNVIQSLEKLIQAKGLDVQIVLPPDLPPVQANVERIDQALTNLVDNAIKYTPSGTITIEAQAGEQQVTVRVSDTGIGLMPREQAKLFGKFYRADNEWTEGIEGTGLGLVLVKSIIEQYGGRIWVQSKWQQGSTFFFSLPRHDQR